MELTKPSSIGGSRIESLLSCVVELRSADMEVDTTVRPAREAVLRHAPKLPPAASPRPPLPKPSAGVVGTDLALADSIGNQAFILEELGAYDESLRLYAEARRLHQAAGNLRGMANGLRNEALARHRKGDLVGSLELFRQEAEILRQLPPT